MKLYYLILFSILMVIVVLDIRAVIDISKYSYKKRDKKWAWTNAVLLFPFFGVFFYYLIGKKMLDKD